MGWKDNVWLTEQLGDSVIDYIPRGNIKLAYLKWQVALIWCKKNISQDFYYTGKLDNGIVLIEFYSKGDKIGEFSYSLEEGDGKFEKALARGFVKWVAIRYGFGFDLHLRGGNTSTYKQLIGSIKEEENNDS